MKLYFFIYIFFITFSCTKKNTKAISDDSCQNNNNLAIVELENLNYNDFNKKLDSLFIDDLCSKNFKFKVDYLILNGHFYTNKCEQTSLMQSRNYTILINNKGGILLENKIVEMDSFIIKFIQINNEEDFKVHIEWGTKYVKEVKIIFIKVVLAYLQILDKKANLCDFDKIKIDKPLKFVFERNISPSLPNIYKSDSI